MELSDEIALRPVSGDEEEPRSEVSIGAQPTGSIVSGRVLEAAVRCNPGWLLLVTNDIPFEETLTIHLLDPAGRVLDSARIGAAYNTGTFSALRLEQPATAHFRFIDQASWSVEVLDTPRTAAPFWSEARGVSRGGSFHRHFVVRRSPP